MPSDVHGVKFVDVLWLEAIECDDRESKEAATADMFVVVHKCIANRGILALAGEAFRNPPDGFDTIEDRAGMPHLYYGDFVELQRWIG